MRNCSVKGAARTIVQTADGEILHSVWLVAYCLLTMLLTQTSLQADDFPPAGNNQLQTPSGKNLQISAAVQVRPMPEKMKQQKVKVLQPGTSSASARKAAIAEIPFDKLTEQQSKVVKQIIQHSGMFRALPALQFECEPIVYQFFTANPDVACSIWRSMEISKLEMFQTGKDEYETDMKDGSIGDLTIVKRGNNSNIIVCNGEFKSPLLIKPIKAVALLHVKSEYTTNKAGKKIVLHTANLFVSFPSQTVETAAKLISPVSNMMIDRNFREITLFTYMMSQAMKHQPGWVEKTAKNLEGVLEVRKKQLVKVTANVYMEHRKAQLRQSGKTAASLDDILQPLRQTSAVRE